MSNLKITRHRGVDCAMATVSLLGSRLNVYVYISGGLLVDTGPSGLARVFTAYFKEQPVKQAVITHYHEDHSGNAWWLEKRGVPVYIHHSSVSTCRERARLPVYRRLFWGKREGFSPRPLPAVLETEAGQMRVIETPGHSFDHITLLDPESGALFTGDLVVSPKTKLVMRTENVPQIMESLRKLLSYDFKTVYCGHAGVVEKGRDWVKAKLDYLEDLRGKVLELHNKGWSIRAINKKLFPKIAPLFFVSCGEWASSHIIRSLIEDDACTKKDRV